jgi:hypothetical protein
MSAAANVPATGDRDIGEGLMVSVCRMRRPTSKISQGYPRGGKMVAPHSLSSYCWQPSPRSVAASQVRADELKVGVLHLHGVSLVQSLVIPR